MRTKNSFLNIVFGSISLVLTMILGFLLSRIFIHNLGLEYNGLNGVFNNIINILAITELGIAGAINYNLYKPIQEKNYKKISSIMVIYRKFYRIVGIIILVLSLIVTIFVPVFFKDKTIIDSVIRISFVLCAINTIISYFFAYNRNLFYAMQKNYIVTIVDFIFKTVKYILQIFVLIVYKNFFVYLIINIIFTFLNNWAIHLLAHKYYKFVDLKSEKVDSNIQKTILTSVKKLSIIQLLSTLINFTDNLIISALISIKSAGLYVNYNFIFSQLTQIINTTFHGFGASIGNMIAEDNKNKIKDIFVNLQYISFFGGLFCATCLYFLTVPFIIWWLGKEYLLGSSVLIVLIINFYLMIQRQPINYYLNTGGYFDRLILPFSLEAIINIIVSIVLAIKCGIIGVFIGTLVSSVVSFIISSKRLCDTIDISYYDYWKKEISFIIITLLNIGLLSILFSLYLPKAIFIRIIYIFIVCFVILIINFLLFIKNDNSIIYLKQLISSVFQKVLKRNS